MSTLVTMTSTVDDLVNGNLVRVRSRTAQSLVAAGKATLSLLKKSDTAKVGKHGNTN